jgi:hypothetical protein
MESLGTQLQQQLSDEESNRKKGLDELHHSFSEIDRSSALEMQQQLEGCRSMMTKLGNELHCRLNEMELQHEKMNGLDLQRLQMELKSQQEKLDLAASLCRNADTAAERLVSAILTGSAFLGCSNILALARPLGLYTVALPLLAAGAGFRCGQRGYCLDDAIKALPQSWQDYVRAAWEHISTHVQHCRLEPLARASKDLGIDRHARTCLTAVTNGAGKLRKRFSPESENRAPSNTDAEAPSPKRARVLS